MTGEGEEREAHAKELRRLHARIETLQADLERLRANARRVEGRDSPHSSASDDLSDPWVDRSLTEREQLLADAEKMARMGSWVWDLRTQRVGWSRQLYEITGYDPERDPASADRFHAAVHPEDLPHVLETYKRVTASGRAEPLSCRLLHRDGSVREVVMNGATIFDDDGQPIRLVGTVVDVTREMATKNELLHTARELSQAEVIAGLGSWRHEFATEAVRWSENLHRLFGTEPTTEVTLDSFRERVHPDDIELFLASQRRAREGEALTRVEFRIVKAGEVRHLLMETSPLHSADGELIGCAGTMLDVTERRRLEERVRKAQQMEAIGRLAGGVAHDFNNLLATICMSCELLMEERASPDLTAIQKAAEHGTALTRQLLTFSRQTHVEPVAVDVCRVVHESLEVLERLLGPDVRVVVNAPRETWGALCDETHVHQLLLNLATNARDAMPSGGALHIDVDCLDCDLDFVRRRSGSAPGEYVRISVRDTGAGMDEGALARIFEPFFTTKEPGRGSGLGLAMVYGIVMQSRGFLDVSSRLGEGTCVRVYFPRTALETRSRAASEIPTQKSEGATILLVEDNEAVARTIERMFGRMGSHRLTVCDRPAKALQAVEAGREFDLLVTDVIMPEMNGWELARRLRERHPNLRVLFISGYSPDPGDARGSEEHFLMKPFTPRALLGAIDRALAEPPQSRSPEGARKPLTARVGAGGSARPEAPNGHQGDG